MVVTKVGPKFVQWLDPRAAKCYGLGFDQELEMELVSDFGIRSVNQVLKLFVLVYQEVYGIAIEDWRRTRRWSRH